MKVVKGGESFEVWFPPREVWLCVRNDEKDKIIFYTRDGSYVVHVSIASLTVENTLSTLDTDLTTLTIAELQLNEEETTFFTDWTKQLTTE